MSNFRSQNQLDDAVLMDGDGMFVGMNLRDPLDQLSEGMLGLSRNGRIDGAWEARRGIELKSGALTTSGAPLRLPFFLLDSSIVVSAAARSSNVVTIDLASAHGLTVADEAYLTLGTPGNATSPLTGVAAGSYLMTVVDADSLSFASTGSDGSLTPDGTHGKVWTYLYDDAVARVWGSCVFSDPSSSLAESVVLATSADAKLVALADYSVTNLPYPTGVTVTGRAELLQAFDRVYLFRDGVRAMEWVPKGKAVVSSAYVSATGVVSVSVKGHGLAAGDGVTLSDIGFATTDPNGAHVVATVVDADNFTVVIATGGGDETYTVNTGKLVADGFTHVLGGPYTQPQTFEIAGNAYGVSGGLVRVTVPSNSTIKAGDFVTVYDSDVSYIMALIGKSYQVTAATSTDIYFYAPVGNVTYGSGSGSQFIQIGGRFSVGGGFMHMPAPPWAVYFQRRLWVPYFYDNGGTASAPTYTDKGERDQIAASDILDGDSYDQIFSQFRITAGIADYLVGMYPFFNDYLMVFNRNSIHVVKGTQGSLSDTQVHELTREVGCLARGTIAGQGNRVFFLSDNGVYGLEFQDEYDLRGVQEPLSKPVQPLMDRVNKRLATEAVGIYFNNRYFLALPLDTLAGADDATGNNSVVIFNMLNGAWESLDTYGGGMFNVLDLLIGQAGKKNDLYLVNEVGGLHLTDARENATDVYSLDALSTSDTAAVDYEVQSRGYNMGNLERKKYHRAQVQLQSNRENATDVDFIFSTEDPDSPGETVADVDTLLDGSPLPAGEAGTFRFRLGNPRGIYGALTIRRKVIGVVPIGRPELASIKIDSTVTNRQTISQQ